MDKSVESAIRQLEKRAAKAERLKKRAATLQKEAADIEATRKPLFEALILKSAYAAGLDRLPLSTIVAGFEALRDVSEAKATMDLPSSAPRVGTSGGLADDATIQLVVKIGRNTAPSRFAVLDQYLAWNGKEGHWSGVVNPAVLTVFKAMFEPERLIVSSPAVELAGEEPSNTSTDVFDNLATTVQHLDPPPTMSPLVTEIDQRNPSNACDQIDKQPTAAINPVESTVLAIEVAAEAGEGIQGSSYAIPSGDDAAEPATTMGRSTTDAEPGAMAIPSTPPEVAGQVLTRLPRSPFAALRRRAGS
jgi:hypothetical protein